MILYSLYSPICPSALGGCHELAQYPEIIILVRFCRNVMCQTPKWPPIYKVLCSCEDWD